MDINKLRGYADRIKKEEHGLDRSIIAKVVGVTFEGRQELLAKILETTSIRLERDRRNTYDFYAVKVMAFIGGAWEHVGFLPKQMNKDICRTLDAGKEIACEVFRLTGGGTKAHSDEPLNYGLDIRITPN